MPLGPHPEPDPRLCLGDDLSCRQSIGSSSGGREEEQSTLCGRLSPSPARPPPGPPPELPATPPGRQPCNVFQAQTLHTAAGPPAGRLPGPCRLCAEGWSWMPGRCSHLTTECTLGLRFGVRNTIIVHGVAVAAVLLCGYPWVPRSVPLTSY